MSEVEIIERTRPPGTRRPSNCKDDGGMSKLRVAAYCRVSTEMEEQLGSFDNQVQTYRQKIMENPEWEFAGIYSDEGISGTRADRRQGFQEMMEDCKAGKIDRILTKSISRFARNVMDSLGYTRKLKSLGVSVYFEEENLNSMDSGAEMLFTILSAVAEQESRNISEHTKWGIRCNFKRGVYQNPAKLNLYAFTEDENGAVILVEKEAEIVRRIYQCYLEGMGITEIAAMLNEEGIRTRKGHLWHGETIRNVLVNEKYEGDVLLQKQFVADFITHKMIKNRGEERQYYIRDAHVSVVDRDTWDAVQEEMKRRADAADANGSRGLRNRFNPYSTKVFFKEGCRNLLTKQTYGNQKQGTWHCRYCQKKHPVCLNPYLTGDSLPGSKPVKVNPERQDLSPCTGFSVNDQIIRTFFLKAWNSILEDGIEESREQWQKTSLDETKTALERIRAKQMLALTEERRFLETEEETNEIARTVLKRMELTDKNHADVYFLDGTVKTVQL